MTDYERKCETLLTQMEKYARQDIVLAFSGGVDSSLLLGIACEKAKKFQTRVYAVTIHTSLHPSMEAEEARKEAEEMGALHRTIRVDELAGAGIEDNPVDRCYRCKRYMFTRLKKLAADLDVTVVLEGTNADDLKEYRPGLQAIRELGLLSPLAETGFTKAEVRKLAAEYGISAADKPSTPCLATRFPYGVKLSRSEMHRVEIIETGIRAMGFYNVRARIHGDLVRIEVDCDALEELITRRSEVITLVKNQGYTYVSLDLEGFRSGSQDAELKKMPFEGASTGHDRN